MKKSFKILAIGNSFSCDSYEYLYRVADSMGEKNIVLGNLFIPGCTIDIHSANALYGAPVYQYFKNTDGQWKSTMFATIEKAVKEEDWDVITMQQGSGSSGMPESFSNLGLLVDCVNKIKPEKTKLMWHMTWAYQGDSNHGHFVRYDRNQTKMYNAICSCVQNQVLAIKDFAGVIPSGTTIQNLRAGYMGDTLTRDGFHLSIPVGRYAAAVTMYFAITDKDVSKLRCDLSGLISKKELAEIKICVKNALDKPFAVTERE